MSESVILITVIASALINPLLNYLINSRCSRIKCCCMECDREVIDLENQKEEK
jgi:hypothetical protein